LAQILWNMHVTVIKSTYEMTIDFDSITSNEHDDDDDDDR